MRVKEFDDLAEWFKRNVLDMRQQHVESDRYEGLYEETIRARKLRLNREQAKARKDELSLIEYIIGIDST